MHPKTMARALPLGLLMATSLPATAADVALDWNLRLRHEQVDDGAFAKDARADTARLRAAIRGSFANGMQWLVEGEGIGSAGDAYNSGANGRTAYPGIGDPSGVELNQAWVGWRGARGAVTAGRQRIAFDNQRWIGNVGWRQNEQTFDALQVEFKPTAALALQYAWLDKAHRVAGDDALDPLARERALDTHLVRAAWTHGKQVLAGYAWLHEDRDVAAASTATYGLRWTGSAGKGWGWTVEAATQRDYAGNPRGFSHAYWLVEPSLQAHGVTWKLGYEHLGGNGAHALQTPLATLHAFNGWADKFTTTPAAGLEDGWLSATGKLRKFTWTAAWHDYRADAGSLHYGSEWNLSLARAFGKRWNGMLKLADYRADGFARDTRKLWLQFEYAGSAPL
jgi:hypothetical protein